MNRTAATLRYTLQNDLTCMIGKCFQELEGDEVLNINWLIRSMSWQLNEVLNGNCKRLIINVPPRHLKTICASVAFPAFVLGKNPKATFMLICYSNELGEDIMRKLRAVLSSKWYRDAFPGTRLSTDRTDKIVTTEMGGVNMTSVNGSLTGMGSDYILIDDPIKAKAARSDTERKKVNEWFGDTLASRLNKKKTGRIVLTMQRLHEDDLTGYLTREPGHPWTILSVPAIAKDTARYRIGNAPQEEWYDRPEGSLIDPRHEDRETVRQMEKDLGTSNFSAQYQQNPLPLEGNLVERSWLRQFDLGSFERSDFDAVVASWDTASAADDGNDYSVGTIWGVREGCSYLLRVYRERLNYPDLRQRIIETFRRHEANLLLLEKADSGRSLAQDLSLRPGIVRAIPPRDSKEDRMSSASFLIEEGEVFVPREAPWLETFLHELLGFPGTRYDDQVDSVSQYLNYIRIKGTDRLRFDSTGRKRRRRSNRNRRLAFGAAPSTRIFSPEMFR